MRAWPLLLWLAACSGQTPFYGPLPMRDQHPVQLTVLDMDPRSARVLGAGSTDLRVDAGYASLFQGGQDGGSGFVMDGEILRARIKARVGLGRGLETWTELPVAWTTGGFLDSFLIEWHDFWNLPDQDRSDNPEDVFEVRAERQGATVYEMEGGELGLMDIPIGLAWNPWADAAGDFDVLLRAAVELPAGDEDEGFGNGEVDVALGVVGEYRLDGWALTGRLQHTFAGTPDLAEAGGLDYRDVTSFGLEAEISIGERTSALVQTGVATSVLRDLGFDDVSNPHWLLGLGIRHLLGDGAYLEVGLGEDLSPHVAPDVTFWLALGWMPSLAALPR